MAATTEFMRMGISAPHCAESERHMLKIESNGSKWAGEEPEGVDYLLATLAETPLHPQFEAYGDFVSPARRTTCERNDEGENVYTDDGPLFADAPDAVCFFGNFWRKTSAFRIYTDEPETIAALTQAIRANQATPAYQAAKREQQTEKPRESNNRRRV